MSEKIYRLNGGVCFCMSEKIYRLNGGGLLLYVREDIPTKCRGSAFVCQRRYTDSMEGVCFCMAEKIYRLYKGGLLLYVREDIPTQ